jgi:hypothetical protein
MPVASRDATEGEAVDSAAEERLDVALGDAVGGGRVGRAGHVGREAELAEDVLDLGRVELLASISMDAVLGEAQA